MEHSYETGVNKKMVFFRMLHSDFSRMIKSWKFYLAIAFIAVLTFLSIYPEAAGSGGNCSVYYLVNARGGVSAFLVTNTILVVLPFALSYWEDVQKNYINCILPRVHSSVYSFSHVLMTAFGGFLAVFLGYSLCFGLMALRLPLITSDEVKASTETMPLMGYDSLLLHAPMLYFAMGKEWEGSILKIIVIGNPLKLSPGFPPLHTGHATFTASGVPSSIVSAVIHNHSFTLAKFATLPPVAAVLR